MTYSSDPITRGELAGIIRDIISAGMTNRADRALSAIARRLESPVASAASAVCRGQRVFNGDGHFCSVCQRTWEYDPTAPTKPPCLLDTA